MKISEEDEKILLELSNNSELIMEGCSHTGYYYGVKSNSVYEKLSEKSKKDVIEIESIMKKYFDDFVSFSNFIPRGYITIRCQSKYDSMFTGVNYIEFMKEKL